MQKNFLTIFLKNSIFEILEHAILQAVTITGFVLVMMIMIEYLTIQSKGVFSARVKNNTWLQIIGAAILGIIPGCFGTYFVVSMYIHRTIALPALVTGLIATSGDEAFIMFSMIPKKAFLIMIILFFVSIISGFLLKILMKNKGYFKNNEDFPKFHEDKNDCQCFEANTIFEQLKKITPKRAGLIIISIIFIILIFTGFDGHEHIIHSNTEHEHEHNHNHWSWERISFLAIMIFGLYISVSVPNHFIDEHIWEHLIKKHFWRLILWTSGTFLCIGLLNNFLDINNFLTNHKYLILLIAVFVGIIPESGPHIIFISLFAGGIIPFSILLANSIVQDGHGAIPLLAESRKSFILAKIINVFVGLLVGFFVLSLGF